MRLAKLMGSLGLGTAASARFGSDLAADLKRWVGGSASVIFDVGANTGQSAAVFAKLFPAATIYAFEPYPPSFEQLKRNVSGLAGVQVFPFALGAEEGRTTLFTFEADVTNSLLQSAPESAALVPDGAMAAKTPCEIESRRLDLFAQQVGVRRIDFLKVDTQGFELQVLAGAGDLLNPEGIGLVQLEMLFSPLYQDQASPSEIFRIMQDKQFRFMGLYDVARQAQDGRVKWCDAVFAGRL
jgi:FkbM family methyltransferase